MHSCSKNSESDLKLAGMLILSAILLLTQRFLVTLASKLFSFQGWTKRKDKREWMRKAWLSCGTPSPTTSGKKSKSLVTLCMLITAPHTDSNGTRTTTMMGLYKMTPHWPISTPTKGWLRWLTTCNRCPWLTRPSATSWFLSETTSLSKTLGRASSTSRPSLSCATSTTLSIWNL